MQKSIFILIAALLAVAIAVPVENKTRTKRVVETEEEKKDFAMGLVLPEHLKQKRDFAMGLIPPNQNNFAMGLIPPNQNNFRTGLFVPPPQRFVGSPAPVFTSVFPQRRIINPFVMSTRIVRLFPAVQPIAVLAQPVSQTIFAQGPARFGRSSEETESTTVEVPVESSSVEVPVESTTVDMPVESSSVEPRIERGSVQRLRIVPALPETLNFDEQTRKFNVSTLCETSSGFKYYREYPEDKTKYVQCNPWGAGEVRSCENGTIWNNWALKCDWEENVKNITLAWEAEFKKASVVVNCTQNELECVNGGVCVIAFNKPKCHCQANFTGLFCESVIDNYDLYHEIVTGSFNASLYKQRLELEVPPVKIGFYEQYANKISKEAYDELVSYLKLWENEPTSVRYDVFVNYLVEEILQNIYPDAFYLKNFNASEQSVVELVRLIPNLLSYAKYSSERYSEVFFEYQSVLERLSLILNETCHKSQDYAVRYTKLTNVFMNQTLSWMNESWVDWQQLNNVTEADQVKRLTDKDVKEKLRTEFNETLIRTNRLFESLNKFHDKVVSEMAVNKGIYNVTLGACNFVGSEEIVTLFDGISRSTSEIWESLVNYGFWVITNFLSQSGSKTTVNFKLPSERN